MKVSQRFSHTEEQIDCGMVKIEVNLDDISGEWLGYVMDRLFEAGANDVFYTPIYMKKNRPGVLLQVLCEEAKTERMKEILFRETTTLGLRYYPLTVHRLQRRWITVSIPWGAVRVKEGLYRGKVVQRAPEYEDCKRLAEENQIPLKEVFQAVWQALGECPTTID